MFDLGRRQRNSGLLLEACKSHAENLLAVEHLVEEGRVDLDAQDEDYFGFTPIIWVHIG